MAKHEHDFRDGLDVCVGNYGYYNEGELHDTWMRLPMDPDKIEPWLRSHGLFDEEHEEIRDETVAEWRAHIAEGVVEKPVTPTDLARSASAAAATSAVIAASANQTAPKL